MMKPVLQHHNIDLKMIKVLQHYNNSNRSVMRKPVLQHYNNIIGFSVLNLTQPLNITHTSHIEQSVSCHCMINYQVIIVTGLIGCLGAWLSAPATTILYFIGVLTTGLPHQQHHPSKCS